MPSNRPEFDPTLDYYAVLDVPFTATRDEITRAYRALMRQCHPDHVRDPDQRRIAEERAKLINAAYAVLSHEATRQAYDQARRQRAVADLLFQRYTGTTPGWTAAYTRAAAARARSADRAAFTHLLVVVVIFLAVLIFALVLSSVLFEAATYALSGL